MSLIRLGWNWLVLACLFVRELTLSVWDVALAVINPARVTHSAIVAMPLDVKSDAGISLLANMITLTPGTISLHVSDDRSVLYVHVMNYAPDIVDKLKSGFERRVLKVFP